MSIEEVAASIKLGRKYSFCRTNLRQFNVSSRQVIISSNGYGWRRCEGGWRQIGNWWVVQEWPYYSCSQGYTHVGLIDWAWRRNAEFFWLAAPEQVAFLLSAARRRDAEYEASIYNAGYPYPL